MLLRFSVLLVLVALYLLGGHLAASHTALVTAGNAAGAEHLTVAMAVLMLVTFLVLVALMYTRILPALLALPILALALASLAGMKWDAIFTAVVQDGSIRLSKWIIAAILGSILAQVVEKTGIAQTAVKKTAELGGDKPWVLTVLLTLVMALLFTTLSGLGAVIMVATIAIPILLSLGLRPLYVGCLFLLSMSLGGAFNLVNWEGYKSILGMSNTDIGRFALPFAGLMLVTTFAFMLIEGKRMGKARYKATTTEETAAPQQFVPWYALLTPVVPLLPVLVFALLPKIWVNKPVEVTIAKPQEAGYRVVIIKDTANISQLSSFNKAVPHEQAMIEEQISQHAVISSYDTAVPLVPGMYMAIISYDAPIQIAPGESIQRGSAGYPTHIIDAPKQITPEFTPGNQVPTDLPASINMDPRRHSGAIVGFIDSKTITTMPVEIATWTKNTVTLAVDPTKPDDPTVNVQSVPAAYDFPITVALLLGILYGVITTWRKGQSTVQLLVKSSFDGVSAVGPALVLLVGIGMVLNATMAPEVSGVITPVLAKVVPHGTNAGAMVHYLLLFAVLAPLALYRGPLNLYGMGAGLIGSLSTLMPAGAIMGAFMSVGMIQGVSDPTNTHNVWIANYTNTDVQDILKRTLPYMWILAVVGLLMSGAIYYLAK
jgi:TRAP-type C4-dicarboxylate transport system permease large subunit